MYTWLVHGTPSKHLEILRMQNQMMQQGVSGDDPGFGGREFVYFSPTLLGLNMDYITWVTFLMDSF